MWRRSLGARLGETCTENFEYPFAMQARTPNPPNRCGWCGDDPLYVAYHDEEWGVPLHDDQRLFELLVLEGAQAGLSWITVLRKRGAYRDAFNGFDVARVAAYTDADVARLLANPGIVRNRLKVASAIRNARGVLAIQGEHGSFDRYLWAFVDGLPVRNAWHKLADLPVRTPLSDRLSKDLKQRGFNFVGSTICYSFLQAAGLVNDHLVDCFRYAHLNRPRSPSSTSSTASATRTSVQKRE
jgi:DNA-3-methyladenine glycosylase I